MLNVFGLILVVFSSQALTAATLNQFEGKAQGTTYHISYTGEPKAKLPALVEKTLAEFDKTFSNYRPDSEISQINAQQSTNWQKLSPELYRILAFALTVSQATEGAFDITLGQELKTWGFGAYNKGLKKVPSESEIAQALKDSGYLQLELRANPPALRKKNPRLLLDLSGIAQGYAVDVVSKLLDQQGLKGFLVEIGGELYARGEKAPGRPWILAIDAPIASQGAIAQTVKLKDLALSTSGNYRDFFEKDGQHYSLIFDPRQGRPIARDIASASVLAKSCLEADAYTKAFMILPEAKRQALAQKLKLPVFLMKHKGSSFDNIYYQDFESYLAFL